MQDQDILDRILSEQHAILAREANDLATREERQRRTLIEAALDRQWELLRHRRARRRAGMDPELARHDLVEA